MKKTCNNCQHWTNNQLLWSIIKKSDFGECNNPKIFGFDYMAGRKKIDKQKQLKDKDEVVIVGFEYQSSFEELPNHSLTTGKNFGCIHFVEKNKVERKPIKTIKISNELMEALVFKLFQVERINAERAEKSAVEGNHIPPLNVDIKIKLDITKKDVNKYLEQYIKVVDFTTDSIKDCPFFSLVSDNATNDLQVMLRQCSEDGEITCDDLICCSNWFICDFDKERKFTFLNII